MPQVYAQAVLETALEPWLKALRQINRRLHERNLITTLDDATLPLSAKKEHLRPILGDMPISVCNFIYTLASKGNVHLLDMILAELEEVLTHAGRGRTGVVRSAVPLTAEEKAALERNLIARFGEDLTLTYEIDPTIIGGLVVRVGDLVMDGSVATKLATLREQLV